MKITKKSVLIELLSGIQILFLLVALLGGAFWVRSQVQDIVRDQIKDDNQLIAVQMSKLIGQSTIEAPEYGSESWDELQSLIEGVSLPNDGYMCIAEAASGQLLCHPDIRTNPELRQFNVGQCLLSVKESKATISDLMNEEGGGIGEQAVTGLLGEGDQTQVVSVAKLPLQNGVLMVHQSERGFRDAVNLLLFPIGGTALVLGLVLIVATKRASVGILKVYENKLANINESLEETVKARTRALTKTRDAVIFGLAKLSESRDNDTGEHLDRIRTYVTILAQKLSSLMPVDPELVLQIGLASSLHDIGKVGVPDEVLLKPGKLTAEERKIIEVHPAIGQECIEAIERQLGEDNFLKLAREICAFHHEKWDGSGYPHGLAGTRIPLSARIVALADVYDALRSRRPYKEPMSHEKAKEIIFKGMGSHFDPDVVDAFLLSEKEFEVYSNKFSSSEVTSNCHAIQSQNGLNSSCSGMTPSNQFSAPAV